jgi:hypothetical protein
LRARAGGGAPLVAGQTSGVDGGISSSVSNGFLSFQLPHGGHVDIDLLVRTSNGSLFTIRAALDTFSTVPNGAVILQAT